MRINNGYHRQLRRKAGLPSKFLDLLALTCVVSERAHKRYAEHSTRPDVAAKTLEILKVMRDDEKVHLSWITDKLKDLESREGREKVKAALHHYRKIEALVFSDMQLEEERALAKTISENTT